MNNFIEKHKAIIAKIIVVLTTCLHCPKCKEEEKVSPKTWEKISADKECENERTEVFEH